MGWEDSWTGQDGDCRNGNRKQGDRLRRREFVRLWVGYGREKRMGVKWVHSVGRQR